MSNHKDYRAWTVEDLKLPTPNVLPAVTGKPGRKVRKVDGLFLKGPVPMWWLELARKQGGPALWLGTCLWLLRGLRKSDTFVLSNVFLDEHGMQPDAKWRALRKLERVGLVRVERRGRKNPTVTIIDGKAPTSHG
jgi:hypothetical protein